MGREKILIRRMKKTDAEAIGKIDAAIEKRPALLDFKQIVADEMKRKVDSSSPHSNRGR